MLSFRDEKEGTGFVMPNVQIEGRAAFGASRSNAVLGNISCLGNKLAAAVLANPRFFEHKFFAVGAANMSLRCWSIGVALARWHDKNCQ